MLEIGPSHTRLSYSDDDDDDDDEIGWHKYKVLFPSILLLVYLDSTLYDIIICLSFYSF